MTLLLNHSLDQVRRDRNNTNRPRKGNDTWKHDLYENGENHSNRLPFHHDHHDHHRIDDHDRDLGRSCSLLITNLHYDVSEAELEALFSQIGKICRGPFIKFDQSGRATEGLAFVSYANESHAEAAVEAFNGASAKGQPIGVEYEHSIPIRIQQDKRPITSTTNRPHFGPGEVNRNRVGGVGSRPPIGGKSRSSLSLTGRDYRRAPDNYSSNRSRSSEWEWNGAPIKSARELDNELEAFMGTPSASVAISSTTPAAAPASDVQMTE
ncbi:hypothetical protein H4Q26_001777 [Puccinia striiformis f. sp. tritici PST-130]|nr:hypothetical protein H4Q26_001777 [Puccinia striiformis f. sp. tritici PST-130]